MTKLDMTWFGRASRDAAALERALSGEAPAPPAVGPLVALAQAARAASPAVPVSGGRDAGRARLLAAVAARRAMAARPSRAHRRAAAFASAAVAGGGLLIASAAHGTDPVTLVRDAVGGLPAVVGVDGAARASFEGIVVAVDAGAGTFDVRTADAEFHILTTGDTRIVAASGDVLALTDVVAGAGVRVRGVRMDGGAVEAREVTLRGGRAPAPAPTDARRDTQATRAPATPSPSPGRDAPGDATRPAATTTPSATPSAQRGDQPTPERTVADRTETPDGRSDRRPPTPTPTPTPPARR